MKVASVFVTPMASAFKLLRMILPRLEQGIHGVEVVGMMFFDDNIYCLCQGDEVGARLARLAAEKNVPLMICDDCALRRGMAEGELHLCGSGEVKAKDCVPGVVAGCFPQLYAALGGNPLDQVITL